MEKRNNIDLFGGVVLVAFSALLGLNQVLIKLVNAGMDPVFQAGLRSLCAFFPVLIFAWLMRRKLSLSDGSLLPGLLSGLLFGVEFIMLFKALDYTSVARASLFFYTMPFWVAIGAHWWLPGERLNRLRVFGLLLAFIGVMIALLNSSHSLGREALLGDALCLVAATFWAAIALLTRLSSLSRARPEMQLLYQLGVSAPILLILAFVTGDILREPTPIIWGIFLFQVLVVVSVGFLTWFWVLSIYPAADMAVYAFLAPVFGVFFGWLILNEHIGWHLLVALTLVALGIVLVNRRSTGKSTKRV
ncbi:MAG: DMT family transporter [Gammaproteobacteria bacterium]|nr:DMT family transporter [Gammaproteobacteria bacterium]